MTVYVNDVDFTLHVGDALETLRAMPDESVHCVVTSPPYFGLRDYGTGSWGGGDDGCDHMEELRSSSYNVGFNERCGKCGARRVDHQLGLEPTPEEYVTSMVAVFREVRRVLRRDGTCWLNLGDGFADKQLQGIPWKVALALQTDGWWLRSEITWCKRNCMPESATDRPTSATEKVFLLTRSRHYFYDQTAVMESAKWDRWGDQTSPKYAKDSHGGFVGNGDKAELSARTTRNMRNFWLLATEPFSEWGQTVRQRRVEPDALAGGKKRTTSPDCPVHGDRPVPAATGVDGEHGDGSSTRTEHTDAGHAQAPLVEFVPTGPRLEPDSAPGSSGSPVPAGSLTATAHNTETHRTASRSTSRGTASAETSCRTGDTSPSSESPAPDGSDNHDSSGTPGRTDCTCTWYVEYTDKTSHFATFPQALVEPCVLAGTSERGCCSVCGAPWERETESKRVWNGELVTGAFATDAGKSASAGPRPNKHTTTLGWHATCECNVYDGWRMNSEVQTDPCTVLDPFMGSGTTAVVARRLCRKSIGIELNEEYAKLAATRLQQLSLLAEPVLERQVPSSRPRGLTGGAYSPPGQTPHSNAR